MLALAIDRQTQGKRQANATRIRISKLVRLEWSIEMHRKILICVQKLCRIERIPDYTGPTAQKFSKWKYSQVSSLQTVSAAYYRKSYIIKNCKVKSA